MSEGKPVPYWSSDCGRYVIYHGDCREVLPHLSAVDAVVTDPPYGIAGAWKGGSGSGWGKADAQKADRNAWDEAPPPQEVFDRLLSFKVPTVVWGGNYFTLPTSRCWLVWNKPERGFSLAEAELAWTNIDAVIRVCDCNRSEPDRVHPTQKPVALMKWSLGKLGLAEGACVLDPFMGSGTTGVACVKAGLSFIGIEREAQWAEVAARRIRDESNHLFAGAPQ